MTVLSSTILSQDTTATVLPDCWGHRGASAAFPENTLASFELAIKDGAEGIETDVHVSADDVILMFHDPDLSRTTNGKGKIKERNWHGPDGMQHIKTKKEPIQSIPTFAETIAFLMKPENRHVTLNLDVKPHNEVTRIFTLMNDTITAQPDWQTALAPRILLGLWHPKFIKVAKEVLPYCRRAHIGWSIDVARRYFWDDVDTFSIAMCVLASPEGRRFLEECKKCDKQVAVWTVNTKEEMVEACRWGVDVIITDHTKTWLDLRRTLSGKPSPGSIVSATQYRLEFAGDYDSMSSQYSTLFYWTDFRYWTPFLWLINYLGTRRLEGLAGPLSLKEVDGVAEVVS
ncbi:PLC-like phosphodiesterase [Coprinopsis marcescibilis]|uniref:PLC-like phosphodiesterase n=1 Tax=Coprinopsis marcescibilis TaxID=230819 RepID=A0A5C3L7B7_COPMA|nr:PLC-like phosphodiesterase [Coprinopsis marcescibilis]